VLIEAFFDEIDSNPEGLFEDATHARSKVAKKQAVQWKR
jgi:hypothetical protein